MSTFRAIWKFLHLTQMNPKDHPLFLTTDWGVPPIFPPPIDLRQSSYGRHWADAAAVGAWAGFDPTIGFMKAGLRFYPVIRSSDLRGLLSILRFRYRSTSNVWPIMSLLAEAKPVIPIRAEVPWYKASMFVVYTAAHSSRVANNMLPGVISSNPRHTKYSRRKAPKPE